MEIRIARVMVEKQGREKKNAQSSICRVLPLERTNERCNASLGDYFLFFHQTTSMRRAISREENYWKILIIVCLVVAKQAGGVPAGVGIICTNTHPHPVAFSKVIEAIFLPSLIDYLFFSLSLLGKKFLIIGILRATHRHARRGGVKIDTNDWAPIGHCIASNTGNKVNARVSINNLPSVSQVLVRGGGRSGSTPERWS